MRSWRLCAQLLHHEPCPSPHYGVKVGASSYTYDSLCRQTNIQHLGAAGQVLDNFTYAYDLASRLTSETDNGTTTSYGCDADNEVTAAGTATYGYDLNGNRTMPGYQTGADNQVTSDGTWTYTYDNEGNLVKKSKGANAETWIHAYDNEKHLVSATDFFLLEHQPRQLGAQLQLHFTGNRSSGSISVNLIGHAHPFHTPGAPQCAPEPTVLHPTSSFCHPSRVFATAVRPEQFQCIPEPRQRAVAAMHLAM